MFCPKCRYEYEPHIFECPDCGEKLVAVLPPAESPDREPEHDDWLELARLTSKISARMVLDVLRAKDIPAVVLSEAGFFGETGQMGPSSFQPVGGFYSVMVPEEYAEIADAEGEALLGDEWRNAQAFEK